MNFPSHLHPSPSPPFPSRSEVGRGGGGGDLPDLYLMPPPLLPSLAAAETSPLLSLSTASFFIMTSSLKVRPFHDLSLPRMASTAGSDRSSPTIAARTRRCEAHTEQSCRVCCRVLWCAAMVAPRHALSTDATQKLPKITMSGYYLRCPVREPVPSPP